MNFNPSNFIASHLNKVPQSGIRKFFDVVVEMEGVISLGVGEPDFTTPWHIREACIHSIEQGDTAYTSNYGILELREEISKKHNQRYGISYNSESEILITTGVSEALDIVIRTIVNPNDEIVVVQPSYVAYVPSIIFAGGVPICVSTLREDEFKITPEILEKSITEKTKAVIINYPNNPTGAVLSKKDLEEIADVIIEKDVMVISDEVYDCLTYNGKHTSFSEIKGMRKRAIILNGFSKSYAMTGFRIGYIMASSELINAMLLIHQYTMLCAPITAQIGAIEALKYGDFEMEKMVREYNRRRHLIVKGLNKIGLDCFEPKGAFYAFPSIESTKLSSNAFSEKLLNEYKVAAVAGDVFGASGAGFLRCSYATTRDEILIALDRIEEFIMGL